MSDRYRDAIATAAVILAACRAAPPPEAAREPELRVPPMPEAGASPQATTAPTRPERHERLTYDEALAEPAAPVPPDARDLTDAELRAPMIASDFVGACGAAESTRVMVKVVLRGGRARGVTVETNPPDDAVARCVDAKVRGMSWPRSPKTDSFTTTY